MIGFRFVSEHRGQYPIARLCRTVGINRSGYYKWRNRAPSVRDQLDAVLLVEIKDIHDRSRGTYGAPRVLGQLARRGFRVGQKRVARLMRNANLVGAHSRKKWRHRRPDVAPAADLVERDFTADEPDRL